jgi:Ca-activated chloride channel homolog
MVAELTAAAGVLAGAAEWLHARRSRRVASLAFGTGRRTSTWVRWLAALRVVGITLLTWGFLTAWFNAPLRRALLREPPTGDEPRVVILLDVSPSMDIPDAGPAENLSRRSRCADVLWERLQRLPAGQTRVTVVAFYSEASPIVVDARDPGVIRHLLYAVPLRQVFTPGRTYLGPGLEVVAKLVRTWPKDSASLIVLSDGGDAEPQAVVRPPAIRAQQVWVLGVGSQHGVLPTGEPSCQERARLQDVADHLGGIYYDCNGTDPGEETLAPLWQYFAAAANKPSRRRDGVLAALLGGTLLAVVPLALTRWAVAGREVLAAESKGG